ncbi:MAG: Ig-like domain-containing protein, partial [Thermoplasmata archaeon]|nr:Ig-like domain-containing protein [Thermoplasmata archaeon]
MEVLIFERGKPVDPDDAWVIIGPSYSTHRNKTLERVSEGVYLAEIEIRPEDVETITYLDVIAKAEFGDERISTFSNGITFRVGNEERIISTIVVPDPKDHYPVAGQTVEYEVWFTQSGEPYDIDTANFSVTFSTDGHGGPSTNVTKADAGRFLGNFTIPLDATHSEVYWISVNRYDGGGILSSREIVARFTFFDYWIHVMEVGENTTTVEVYLTHKDGRPVVGASINLSSTSGRYDAELVTNAVTDENGRVEMVIGSTSMLWGNVSHNGLFQEVMGDLNTPEEPQSPYPGNGKTPRLVNIEPLPPDTQLELEYLLLDEGVPVDGRLFYLYIFDRDQIIWSGTRITDDDGKFTIPFTTPTVKLESRAFDDFHIYIHYIMEDRWYQTRDTIYYG